MWRDMGFRRPVAGCFNGPKKRRHPPPGHPCPRQPFSGLVPGSALASGNRRCQRGWRSRLHQVHDLALGHGAQRDQFSTVMCRGLLFSILYIAESSSSLPNSGAPGLAWTQRQRPPADWRAGLTPPDMCVGTLRRTVVRCGCDAISRRWPTSRDTAAGCSRVAPHPLRRANRGNERMPDGHHQEPKQEQRQ
jgi:hypothetical protein